MKAFIKAFAEVTGLSEQEAGEQWAAYSRLLTDKARTKIEKQGAKSGKIMGQQFNKDYPK